MTRARTSRRSAARGAASHERNSATATVLAGPALGSPSHGLPDALLRPVVPRRRRLSPRLAREVTARGWRRRRAAAPSVSAAWMHSRRDRGAWRTRCGRAGSPIGHAPASRRCSASWLPRSRCRGVCSRSSFVPALTARTSWSRQAPPACRSPFRRSCVSRRPRNPRGARRSSRTSSEPISTRSRPLRVPGRIDRFGMTHEAVARQVGKSRVAVSNALRLLDLAPEDAAGDHRRPPERGAAVARSLRSRSPSFRAPLRCRARARSLGSPDRGARSAEARGRSPGPEPRPRRPEAQLRGILATKVGIVRTRKGGRLVIDFYSDEELDRLYSIITRGAGGQPPTIHPDIRRPRGCPDRRDRLQSGRAAHQGRQLHRRRRALLEPCRRSACAPACTSARPTRAAFIIWCGRSSITASTRRWRTRPRAST